MRGSEFPMGYAARPLEISNLDRASTLSDTEVRE